MFRPRRPRIVGGNDTMATAGKDDAMKAWVTARRVKKGKEDAFRKKWRGGDEPEGMVDSFLLEDEEDPRETLSVSLWDSAESLLAYRTGQDAKKRRDELADTVEKDRWSRDFVGFNAWDLPSGGGKKKLLVLPLLLAIGGGVFYFLKMRKGSGNDDEWANWEPESADTFQPSDAQSSSDGGSSSVTVIAPSHGAQTAASGVGSGPPRASGQESGGQSGGARGTSGQGTAPNQSTGGHEMAHTPTNAGNLVSGEQRPLAGSAATGSGGAAGGQGAPMRRSGQRVRDLMTPNPSTVESSDSTHKAAELMRSLNVGVLPVMADGRLAGMVTDRDLALGVSRRKAKPDSVRVGDLMTEAPVTATPEMSVDDAAKLMADHQVRRLPVVEGSRLIGILALGDLAADGAEADAATALHEISEPPMEGR